MQEQLQLMYIQAMLVDSQLCLGSSKQYDLLKMVFTMMLITQLVKRDYLFNCMSLTVCDLVRFNQNHKYLHLWLVDCVPVGTDCDVSVFV